MTIVIDTGLGVCATEGLLEVAGDYIDLWKLSFGTSIFVRPEVLPRKCAIISSGEIMTCPGGTLFEAAILQRHCRVYMSRAVQEEKGRLKSLSSRCRLKRLCSGALT